MFDFFRLLLGGLIPPTDASPSHILRYRMFVSGTIMFLMMLTSFHLVLECGWAPWIFPGFANAAELHQLEATTSARLARQDNSIDWLRRDILESQLFQLQSQECKTTDGAFKEELSEHIQQTLDEFYSIPGTSQWRLPGCERF